LVRKHFTFFYNSFHFASFFLFSSGHPAGLPLSLFLPSLLARLSHLARFTLLRIVWLAGWTAGDFDDTHTKAEPSTQWYDYDPGGGGKKYNNNNRASLISEMASSLSLSFGMGNALCV
jgi:hypothetical protein